MSLESAFALRKPVHGFGPGDLATADISQLLWAAQGARATPAMAIPLEIYVAQRDGVVRYSPESHGTVRVGPSDIRKAIAQASGEPADTRDAPALIVFVTQPGKGHAKYGDRAARFAAIETGHAAQNVLLQAVALGLAATPLAVFDESAIREALLLPEGHVPMHLLAVGHSQ